MDSEIYYYVNADIKQITGEDFQFVCENGTYYGNLICDGNYNDRYANILMSDSTYNEKVVSAVDKGSVISLITELDEEHTAENGENIGEAYKAGDTMKFTYQLDSKTLAMISSAEELIHADSTTTNLGSMSVNYGAERSDDAKQTLERAKPNADIRTLTVVLDPNTQDE